MGRRIPTAHVYPSVFIGSLLAPVAVGIRIERIYERFETFLGHCAPWIPPVRSLF